MKTIQILILLLWASVAHAQTRAVSVKGDGKLVDAVTNLFEANKVLMNASVTGGGGGGGNNFATSQFGTNGAGKVVLKNGASTTNLSTRDSFFIADSAGSGGVSISTAARLTTWTDFGLVWLVQDGVNSTVSFINEPVIIENLIATGMVNIAGSPDMLAAYAPTTKSLVASSVSNSEAAYLSGVTQAIQTQINALIGASGGIGKMDATNGFGYSTTLNGLTNIGDITNSGHVNIGETNMLRWGLRESLSKATNAAYYQGGVHVSTFGSGGTPGTGAIVSAKSPNNSNTKGTTLALVAGQSLGNATPGNVVILTGETGANGSQLNPLVSRFVFSGGNGHFYNVSTGIFFPSNVISMVSDPVVAQDAANMRWVLSKFTNAITYGLTNIGTFGNQGGFVVDSGGNVTSSTITNTGNLQIGGSTLITANGDLTLAGNLIYNSSLGIWDFGSGQFLLDLGSGLSSFSGAVDFAAPTYFNGANFTNTIDGWTIPGLFPDWDMRIDANGVIHYDFAGNYLSFGNGFSPIYIRQLFITDEGIAPSNVVQALGNATHYFGTGFVSQVYGSNLFRKGVSLLPINFGTGSTAQTNADDITVMFNGLTNMYGKDWTNFGILTIGSNGLTTISQGGSNVMQLSVGGAARITITTNAINIGTNIYAISGSSTAPPYSFAAETNMGMYYNGASDMRLVTGGNDRLRLAAGSSFFSGTLSLGNISSGDVTIGRDAAGVLYQRNTVNPQTNRVYGRAFGSTNTYFLESGFDDGNGRFFVRANTNASGTTAGTNYPLVLGVNSQQNLRLETDGSATLQSNVVFTNVTSQFNAVMDVANGAFSISRTNQTNNAFVGMRMETIGTVVSNQVLYSPVTVWSSHSFKGNATSETQTNDFGIMCVGVGGGASTTENLIFMSRTNSGPWTTNGALTSAGGWTSGGSMTSGGNLTIAANGQVTDNSKFIITGVSASGISFRSAGGGGLPVLHFGPAAATNSAFELVSGSQPLIRLRDATTNAWADLALGSVFASTNLVSTNGIATYSTNTVLSANAAGFTNTSAINMVANIYGTSGNIVYWNRSGAGGQTVCGTSVFTNTVSATGVDYIVPVNSGIQITTGVGVIITERAQ